MDLFPNEQNFDPDKSRQTFYHSLKEHHKISNIPKIRLPWIPEPSVNNKLKRREGSVLKPLILFCNWRGLIKESSR
jgi:hypothetical protein